MRGSDARDPADKLGLDELGVRKRAVTQQAIRAGGQRVGRIHRSGEGKRGGREDLFHAIWLLIGLSLQSLEAALADAVAKADNVR